MSGVDVTVVTKYWPVLLRGLGNTTLFSAAAIVLGLVIGVVLALSHFSRRALIRLPARAVVQLLRNTPFLIQVFVVYYVLPALGISLAVATAGIISLALFGGAYFAESIRGAIASVPRGQMDAARATGMSYALGMRRIVAPQMLGYLIPTLTNNMIGVVKDSAVLSIITVPEITMATQIVVGETFSAAEGYALTALLYWAITASIATAMGVLERRSASRHVAGVVRQPPPVTVAME